MIPRRRRVGRGVTAAALALIAAATLVPAPSQAPLVAQTPVWCLVCGELGTIDVLLNVALFCPLGAGLVLLGLPRRRAVLAGALLSLVIEVIQYFAIIGRDASLSDVLTNTAGVALGAVLAAHWRSWVLPSRQQAKALVAAAAAAWLVQVAATGAAVLPALPRSQYWGQRVADLPQFDTFPGVLLHASVGDGPFPNLRMPNSAEIRDRLLQGQKLGAVAVPAGPTRSLAPIVSVFDGDRREIVLLGQWRTDLVFQLRSRAEDLRLRPPAIRLPGVLAHAGDTLRLAGALEGTRLTIEAGGPGGRAAQSLELSAQWGWSLLLPFAYAFGAEAEWITAVWIGCWLFVVGYWLRSTGIPGGRAALLGAGLLAAGVAGVPAIFGLAGAWADWVAGAAGLAGGWWLCGRAGAYATAPPSARSASSP